MANTTLCRESPAGELGMDSGGCCRFEGMEAPAGRAQPRKGEAGKTRGSLAGARELKPDWWGQGTETSQDAGGALFGVHRSWGCRSTHGHKSCLCPESRVRTFFIFHRPQNYKGGEAPVTEFSENTLTHGRVHRTL